MTAPTMRPEEALRQAFDELDQANRLVEEQSMAQAEAQKQVAKTSALQTETQHQLENAEAKYRVLLGSAELLPQTSGLCKPGTPNANATLTSPLRSSRWRRSRQRTHGGPVQPWRNLPMPRGPGWRQQGMLP